MSLLGRLSRCGGGWWGGWVTAAGAKPGLLLQREFVQAIFQSQDDTIRSSTQWLAFRRMKALVFNFFILRRLDRADDGSPSKTELRPQWTGAGAAAALRGEAASAAVYRPST